MTHKDLSWSIESTITFATISRRNYRQIPWQRDTKRIRLKHFFTGLFLTKGCQCFFPFSFFLSPPNFLSLSSSLVLSCTVDTRLHASFELHRQKRLSNGCYCGALTSIRCDSLFELFRGKKTDRQETAATRAWPHLCLLLKKKRKKEKRRKKKRRKKERAERVRATRTNVFYHGCKIVNDWKFRRISSVTDISDICWWFEWKFHAPR